MGTFVPNLPDKPFPIASERVDGLMPPSRPKLTFCNTTNRGNRFTIGGLTYARHVFNYYLWGNTWTVDQVGQRRYLTSDLHSFFSKCDTTARSIHNPGNEQACWSVLFDTYAPCNIATYVPSNYDQNIEVSELLAAIAAVQAAISFHEGEGTVTRVVIAPGRGDCMIGVLQGVETGV